MMAMGDEARADVAANKAVAIAFLEAIAAGDGDVCAALIHPEATWWIQGWGDMAGADFLVSLRETIGRSSSRAMTITGVTAEADRVAVQARGEFRFPEGVYANSYHYLFRIADGQIFAGFEYLDTAIASRFFAASAVP
jgi:ketosteroid isomerase-like protein